MYSNPRSCDRPISLQQASLPRPLSDRLWLEDVDSQGFQLGKAGKRVGTIGDGAGAFGPRTGAANSEMTNINSA